MKISIIKARLIQGCVDAWTDFKSQFKFRWHLYAVIVMLITLVVHFALALEVSRENERELSRRNYQTARDGK